MQKIGLVCFPYAGSGASFFRTWQGIDDRVKILPVQLAGREDLFLVPPYQSIQEAVSKVLEPTLELMGDMDIVIFGHSLGAALAFEMAHRVRDRLGTRLRMLVASGSGSPLHPRVDRASDLTGDQFIDKVQELSGYSDPSLQNPEIRELVLPTLYADVKMHENYEPTFFEELDIPVLTLRGAQDHLIDNEAIKTWMGVTSGHIANEEVPGGHMYVLSEGEQIIDKIIGALHLG